MAYSFLNTDRNSMPTNADRRVMSAPLKSNCSITWDTSIFPRRGAVLHQAELLRLQQGSNRKAVKDPAKFGLVHRVRFEPDVAYLFPSHPHEGIPLARSCFNSTTSRNKWCSHDRSPKFDRLGSVTDHQSLTPDCRGYQATLSNAGKSDTRPAFDVGEFADAIG